MGDLARSSGPLTGTGRPTTARRLRVLWISQNLPFPPKTGVLQRNYNLLREASRWADIDLVAILKEDILPGYDAATAERELLGFCRSVTPVRLPIESSRGLFLSVVVKSLFTTTPFTTNWAETPVLRRALEQAAGRGPFDAVFFDTISLAQYRGRFAGTVRVLNHHNIESRLFERRLAFETNPLKRAYYRMEARKLGRYEAAVAGDFDVNTVVSELDGARLREICPTARTAVVANGVDTGYFRVADRAPEPGHLIMVSGMNWFPNLDAVLYMTRDIWPRLIQERGDLRLTIVGASPPPEVQEIATRDSRVTVTGFVDDVRTHMDRAQVYLCPMRDGGGTRLKILDALSMGKPIVATTMALEGIDVTPESDVLVADTPDAFVRQVLRLVDDAALCRRLGGNGRAFAESSFAWPVIGSRMHQTFETLVEARNPSWHAQD